MNIKNFEEFNKLNEGFNEYDVEKLFRDTGLTISDKEDKSPDILIEYPAISGMPTYTAKDKNVLRTVINIIENEKDLGYELADTDSLKFKVIYK